MLAHHVSGHDRPVVEAGDREALEAAYGQELICRGTTRVRHPLSAGRPLRLQGSLARGKSVRAFCAVLWNPLSLRFLFCLATVRCFS